MRTSLRSRARWKEEKRLLKRAALIALFVAAPAFCSLVTDDPNDAVARIDTIVQTGKPSAAVVNELVQALKNPDANIRVKERAAWALGELEAKSAAPALIEGCKHKGLLVRSASLNALSRLRTKTALPVFTSIAQSDPILSLRQNATIGLGLLQDDKAIPVLAQLAADPTPEVRGAAALAMAASHSKKNNFSQALEQMKGDENPYVQQRASAGLDVVNRKNNAVAAQLKSTDADVRLFAALYFQHHGNSKDLQELKDAWNGESDEATRAQLQKAIVAVKKRAAAAQTKTPSSTTPHKSGTPKKKKAA